MRSVVIHPPHRLSIEEAPPDRMGAGQVTVAVRAGGICGSDMHYYRHGGFGTVRVKESMVLGHEVSGEVLAVADDVRGLRVGDRVAVNPSRPCRACRYCLEGLPNHCENMRFYGSAMLFPHVQGAFRERLVLSAMPRNARPYRATSPSRSSPYASRSPWSCTARSGPARCCRGGC